VDRTRFPLSDRTRPLPDWRSAIVSSARSPLRVLLPLLFLLVAVVPWNTLSGCGGSSGRGGTPTPTPSPTPTPLPPGQTRAVFTVQWSARGRALVPPGSTLSLRMTLGGARPDGSDLNVSLNRSFVPISYTDTITSTDAVRVGTWQAVVTCYSDRERTGVVVGTGRATVTIAEDGTGIGDIAIPGIVSSVTIATGQSVRVGTLTELTITCRDSSGALVPVSPGTALIAVLEGSDNLWIVNGQGKWSAARCGGRPGNGGRGPEHPDYRSGHAVISEWRNRPREKGSRKQLTIP
jgi:hypothetical protein